MSMLHLKDNEWDLIADEVLDALDAEDAAALEGVDPSAHARARQELEQTAGALAAALAQSHGRQAMPASVAQRVTARCQQMAGVASAGSSMAGSSGTGSSGAGSSGASSSGAGRTAMSDAPRINTQTSSARQPSAEGRSVIARIGPWLIAAAACVVAAVSAWPTDSTSPRQQLALLREQAPDTRVAQWGDWALEGQPPQVAGVGGEIVWSDEKQAGVMRFNGLPPCQAGQRYQLWIVDAQRGFEQRISGAIFDGAPGELYVPVKPEIPVHEAAAFAVTIEEEAGTWVSDMSRRVVIAMVK